MSVDVHEFRNALGRFATGISVIVARQEGEEPFAMTVNSFASVSLDPPLILWSLQKGTDCFNAFESAELFSVNILTENQQDISQRYAQKDNHILSEGLYRQGRSGAIVLHDVMTSFECKVEATHDGGDHVIIIGRVLEIHNHPANRKPLVFYSGKYRELK